MKPISWSPEVRDEAALLSLTGGSLVGGLLRSVAERSDEIAVASATESLTWAEVGARAASLAATIQDVELGPDDPVALVVGHDHNMLVGLAAIWLAGRVAVPIDPHDPAERIRSTLSLAAPACAVVDEERRAQMQRWAPNLATVGLRSPSIADVSAFDRSSSAGGDDEALVLFTSGTTGAPVGVVHTHRSVLHNAVLTVDAAAICSADRLSLLVPPTFFAATTTIAAALYGGACLCAFDPASSSLDDLVDFVSATEMTVMLGTPGVIGRILDHAGGALAESRLRLVITGGEPLRQRDREAVVRELPNGCSILHRYSSTETGWVAGGRVSPSAASLDDAGLIGWSVPGKEVRIDPGDGEGEGAGLVVSSRFVPKRWLGAEPGRAPEVPSDGCVVVRTGDAARRRDDGALIHLGRTDRRIKVAGVTVELAAIESALLSIDEVADACVVSDTRSSGNIGLRAYLVLRPGATLDVDSFRAGTAGKLRAAHVPADVAIIDVIPRTARGKVDEVALDDVPKRRLDRPGQVPPEGSYERIVAEVWRRSLGRDGISRHDGWFDLGGDSMGALAMLTELERVLSTALPPSVIAEAATLAELASRARQAVESSDGGSPGRAVVLNSGEPGRSTIAFLPGLRGAGLAYRLLVPDASPDRPIVTIDAHGLSSGETPLLSMTAMASRYLHCITSSAAAGPIAPAGGSFGGLLAWELARQMLDMDGGEPVEVPLVVLVDTYAPDLAARHSPSMVAGAAESRMITARRRASTLARRLGLRGGLASLSLSERQRRLRASSLYAARRYQIEPLPLRALVFASEERRRTCGRDDLGWSELALGGVQVVPLEGGHHEIFSHPAIGVVGAAIERELEAFDRSRSWSQG